MFLQQLFNRIHTRIKRLNGCTVEHDLAPYRATVQLIETASAGLDTISDSVLREQFHELRVRARAGEAPAQLLPAVYALVREAAWRALHLRAFDTQLLGAIVLQKGAVAQLPTGEGKTLVAVFAACLASLNGGGVHVLTFNDYLARRDALWMGPVYEMLGVSVGWVTQGRQHDERRLAYRHDVTYVTAREAGFDFLRDSLCRVPDQLVQRPFTMAIIDEADSVLIDEARVPLVIAQAQDGRADAAPSTALVARCLEPPRHIEFDRYQRTVILTEDGIEQAERMLGCGNLFDSCNAELLTRLYHAIHAQHLLARDRDYIVRDGRVELVDEFTGRVAKLRRWPDGLQAAVETKEGCGVQSRGTVLNAIPLQHFLGLYPRLCGMTATAAQSYEELRDFYGLPVVVIPASRPCIRIDMPDRIFATREQRDHALLDEILSVNRTGRPILVGTSSVRDSALLAQRLAERGVPCEILNAYDDAREAQIIADAASTGAVTISTNMAGRGTDIRLGGPRERERAHVLALGGLYVIGTTRHESCRIDDQLRGRAGRQGDPGSTRFFVSLEDSLFVRYRLSELLPAEFILDSGTAGERLLRREIERLQRIVEGQNLEVKTALCRYALVLEQQRRLVASHRDALLHGPEALELLRERAPGRCRELEEHGGAANLTAACRAVALEALDSSWSRYQAEFEDIRDTIHLRRLGGQDPLFEFRKLAIEAFERLRADIEQGVDSALDRLAMTDNFSDVKLPSGPSATWTYAVNDDPFEHRFALQMASNAGITALSGFLWPLTMVYLLAKKWTERRRRTGAAVAGSGAWDKSGRSEVAP